MPQQMTLGLADTAAVNLLNSSFQALPLPVSLGSMRIRIDESPICPFTLSMAKSACALPPANPYQALEAPMQRINWFVWVASTEQVAAQALQAVSTVKIKAQTKGP